MQLAVCATPLNIKGFYEKNGAAYCTQHYADFSAQITSLRGKTMKRADFDEATRQLVQLILSGCGLTVPEKYLESAK